MRKILTFLIILFAVFTMPLCAQARTQSVKFVQATDVHYVKGNEEMQQVLKSFVKSVNSIDDLDFVVFTGDNIDVASADALKELLKTVRGIKVPVYYVIGNHDVFKSSDLDKDKYLEILRRNNLRHPIWKSNYKFKKNGFVFLVVDGAKQIIPGPAGYYKKDTLAWVDKELTKNSKKKVVIFQHFPLIAPRHNRTHETYKAEEYLEILDKHENVVAVVSGHFHTNKEEMRNGVYHVSSPAFGHEPHYYKLIEIVQNKDMLPMVFTQLREFDL